jgi:hypothetical protein
MPRRIQRVHPLRDGYYQIFVDALVISYDAQEECVFSSQKEHTHKEH